MRYAPGHKGPTLPGPRPRTPAVSTRPPRPAPTGPMTPVRGGGMAPASVATMMKKAPMMKKGGSVSSASKRADGIAKQGKTKGKII